MDKLNAELERFDVEQIKNIVLRFIYKHNLMDLKHHIARVAYYAMIVDSPAPKSKWELVHNIEDLINEKNDLIFDLLDDDRVSSFDREKFNNEFNRYVSPLYHAAYDL